MFLLAYRCFGWWILWQDWLLTKKVCKANTSSVIERKMCAANTFFAIEERVCAARETFSIESMPTQLSAWIIEASCNANYIVMKKITDSKLTLRIWEEQIAQLHCAPEVGLIVRGCGYLSCMIHGVRFEPCECAQKWRAIFVGVCMWHNLRTECCVWQTYAEPEILYRSASIYRDLRQDKRHECLILVSSTWSWPAFSFIKHTKLTSICVSEEFKKDQHIRSFSTRSWPAFAVESLLNNVQCVFLFSQVEQKNSIDNHVTDPSSLSDCPLSSVWELSQGAYLVYTSMFQKYRRWILVLQGLSSNFLMQCKIQVQKWHTLTPDANNNISTKHWGQGLQFRFAEQSQCQVLQHPLAAPSLRRSCYH